jgi:hypothetical protein
VRGRMEGGNFFNPSTPINKHQNLLLPPLQSQARYQTLVSRILRVQKEKEKEKRVYMHKIFRDVHDSMCLREL